VIGQKPFGSARALLHQRSKVSFSPSKIEFAGARGSVLRALFFLYSLAFCATRIFVNSLPTELELELELIQTQMTQKPLLRAEVYARALRASQNRKEDTELES
jgi:hypothetical protein